MKTKTLFLEDAYTKEMEAVILDVQPEGDAWKLILSQTVFYPMGGGQATDQGKIEGSGWQGAVYQVLMKDGEIVHYIKGTKPTIGDSIKGTIDWQRRYKNMRLHSAGHVVDFALYLLGLSPTQLKPMKADHGKKPYIVYQGTIAQDFQKQLQEKTDELVNKNLSFTTQFISYPELEKLAIYLQPGLPTNKPLRALTLEGVGSVADGGTQVNKTSEVGPIVITNVEQKEGNTLIYYQLSQ